MNDTIKALRKAVKASKIEDGTVVAFDVTITSSYNDETKSKTYAFVALYVASTRKWWLTGTGRMFPTSATHAEFTNDILGHERVSDIAVATGWEAL